MLTKDEIDDYKSKRCRRIDDELTDDCGKCDHASLCGLRQLADQAALAVDLQSEVEQLKAERRWIPVSDRLPKDDGKVWAITSSRNLFLAHYDHKWKCWRVSHTIKITHWMPLPEPPKE